MEKLTISPAIEKTAELQDRAEKFRVAAELGEERISDKLEELDKDLEEMELFERVNVLKEVLQKAYDETSDYYLSEYLAGLVTDAEIDLENAMNESRRPAWAKDRASTLGFAEEDLEGAA